MTNTFNQNLARPADGQADWDTDLNANFNILDRGLHLRVTAGAAVSSGQVCTVLSGFALPYDANSYELGVPAGIAYTNTASGAEGYILGLGHVSSVGVWSSTGLGPAGQEVFVDPRSTGFVVNSRQGVSHAVGIALGRDRIFFNPRASFPRLETHVASFAGIVGSSHLVELPIGRRGIVRKLIIQSDSSDAHKVEVFASSNTTVVSGRLYETLTTSVDGGAGDYDINTPYYIDQALFPYNVISVESGYGNRARVLVTVQSANSVGSSNFSVTMEVERTR